ncbi:hypothetical protein HYW17_05420 [Candidatus Uhrbacteria bacterium]|nr:hypothetical protein [Candidatus Uhrbacteria bacterium]
MTLWLIITLIQFTVSILVTGLLWSKRSQRWARRALTALWVINIAVSAILLMTLTSLGAFAYYVYSESIALAEGVGFPAAAGKLLAWAGAGLGVWGLWELFSLKSSRRWFGASMLGALVVIFVLISVLWDQRSGYAIALDGRAKFCSNPGGLDLESGQRCYRMTAQMIQLLNGRDAANPPVLEKNSEDAVFFDLDDGSPVRYWCERGDGNCWLARAQIYDPQTGRECEPIDLDLVKECRMRMAPPTDRLPSKRAAPSRN